MFFTPLCIVADPLPDYWVVYRPLYWNDPVYGIIEVPEGFRTDLASIPRIFRNLQTFDPNGVSRRPAAGHDWLYAERSKGKDFADRFLRDALIAEGMSRADADVYYEAVHLFGESSWNSDAGALGTRDFDTPEHFINWSKPLCVNSSLHS